MRIAEVWGVDITEKITYEYLWELVQREKQTNQLQPISKTFYKDALLFLNPANESTGQSDRNLKENGLKLLNDLFEKRKQKILIYIAYNKSLPQPTSNLEADFYNRVSEIAIANKIDSAEIANRLSKTSLRSLKDIPEIVLPSGAKIGPFIKNQTIELKDPNDLDVEFLVNNTICEKV